MRQRTTSLTDVTTADHPQTCTGRVDGRRGLAAGCRRQLLLQQAAQQLETARIEANRQQRYLSVSVSPVAPDVASYPRAFENTAVAFLIFAGIYLMIALTASILREQVSS